MAEETYRYYVALVLGDLEYKSLRINLPHPMGEADLDAIIRAAEKERDFTMACTILNWKRLD